MVYRSPLFSTLINQEINKRNEYKAPKSSTDVRQHGDIGGFCNDGDLHMDTKAIQRKDGGDYKWENWVASKMICRRLDTRCHFEN